MTDALALTRWTDRLAFDMALLLEGSGETLDTLKSSHKITTNDLLVFNKDPVFLKRVGSYRAEIRDKGLTFKLKARSQAEMLLDTSWVLIHAPDVSPAVKADLIKSTVKWAGLEPRNDEQVAGGGGGVRISINLGGQAGPSAPLVVAADVEDAEVLDAHDADD